MKGNRKDIVSTSAIVLLTGVAFFFLFQKKGDVQGDPAGFPVIDYWAMFEKITKERKYFEEVEAYYRVPVFTSELLEKAGTEIQMTGYYLPYSDLDSVIIISRFPNASCFFCGQAGIESVVMVELTEARSVRYRMDQKVTVRGKLMLNSSDVKKLAFVIEEASVEEVL